MIDRQLCMLLGVVVCLVMVVGGGVRTVGCGSGIFACRIVAAVCPINTVSGVVVHTIPTHASLLATAKETCNNLCTIAIPTQITIIGIQI